ncbi:MAG: toxin-antitoxin system YwqK family antitoxin [Crocinitomicaceae bacterium]|nr:toxin-antitoxin system YwqK family antitoxin [Flavobacteriales bacterium]NQZ35790.1 toxin-antitoxin system YwqK family antitoxin [Crocinitomicaceae bacterium]
MKSVFVLLFGVLVGFGVYGQRYSEDQTVCPKGTITFLKSDMEPLNGIVFNDHGDIGEFIDGKRNGTHKFWDENGLLKAQGTYKDGEEYTGKKFYENGQVSWESTSTPGVGHNSINTWYEDGTSKGELTFKKGLPDGVMKSWYENGQLEHKGSYELGDRIGVHTYWYNDGRLKSEKTYEDGTLISCKGVCD